MLERNCAIGVNIETEENGLVALETLGEEGLFEVIR